MASRFAPAIRRTWLQQELYGWRHAPSLENCKTPFLYAKLLLSATGAAPEQREYVLGMFYALNGGDRTPDGELIQYVHHYHPSSAADDDEVPAADFMTASHASDAAVDKTGASTPSVRQLIAMTDEPLRPTDGVKLRVLLYDALSASRATRDDVPHEASAQPLVSRDAILSDNEARVAHQLGLSAPTAERIARLCDREAALVARRRRLLRASHGAF